MRCGFLVISRAQAWEPIELAEQKLTLRSGRTGGTLTFSTTRADDERHSYRAAELWERARSVLAPRLRCFDEKEWIVGTVDGIAFSTVQDLRELDREELPPHHPEFQSHLIRRYWSFACGPRLVGAVYTSVDEPHVLFDPDGREVERNNRGVVDDLIDCEEMIRVARFDDH